MENFAGILGISLQKLNTNFVFKSNFYNFKYWKSELGIKWLLQHFYCCNWHNSLLCHIYYKFSISFIIYLILVNIFFWKYYTCPMDMKFFKHVPNSLRYWKIKLDHYTYMKKSPPNHIFTSFLRSKKASSSKFECKFLRV